ncbi:hypothetical protein [Lactococcus ileimucosae]|uniref:hypothetical protein n=1 Tax=Lactococcus ileimucosae TaxID=2941329 RepID=UPI003514A061
MIKFPIQAQKFLGDKITVDKNIKIVPSRDGKPGYTRYLATSKKHPEGFEIRVEGGNAAKPTRRQEVLLTGVKLAQVRNRTPKGKYAYEYVIYADSLKLA